MIREVAIGAGNTRCVGNEVLRFEPLPVRRQNELRLGPRRGRARLQRGQRLRDLAGGGDSDMDVVGLKDSPRSDLFDSPFRSRLRVVSLLPKASRKANGNSSGSKGRSASADTASSISIAFITRRASTGILVARRVLRFRASAPYRLDPEGDHAQRKAPPAARISAARRRPAPRSQVALGQGATRGRLSLLMRARSSDPT